MLAPNYSLGTLKDRFGHNLIMLWGEFENIYSPNNPATYFYDIESLSKIFRIRYPDGKHPSATVVGFSPNYMTIKELQSKKEDRPIEGDSYFISIPRIDDLAFEIISRDNRKPAFYFSKHQKFIGSFTTPLDSRLWPGLS